MQGTDWGGSEPLKFTTYYKITDQRYGIYWLFAGDNPAEIQKRLLESKKNGRDANVYLEGVGIGYGAQTEGDDNNYPHIKNEGTGSTGDMGNLTRYANVGGSFSYLFKVDKSKTNYLNCQYSKEDNGKTMIIKVGDVVIAEQKLNYDDVGTLYKVKYEIPAAAIAQAESYEKKDNTTGKTEIQDVIRISFSGAAGEESPRLWESAYTSTNYDNNAGIERFTSDIGTVKKTSTSEYRLEVPADTEQVQIKTDLANKFGLLYMDDVLTDDTKAKKIVLKEKETVINIRVFAEDHQTKADYKLTIVKTNTDSKPTEIKVRSVTVRPTKKSLSVGETLQLTYTVSPANASNKGVTFKTSKSSVAAVNPSTGKVTAKKAGKATITVMSKEDNKIKSTCEITVKKPSITITGKSEVAKGKSIKLKVSYKNVKGKVKWSIDTKSKKYATLKAKGNTATIKAKKKVGKVKVTVKVGSVKKTKTIQVVNPVKSIKLNAKKKTLKVKKSFKLKAVIGPKNATNKKVTYKSSNKKVATVNSSGKVTAKKKGKATITVTSKSNPKVKAKCKIVVK